MQRITRDKGLIQIDVRDGILSCDLNTLEQLTLSLEENEVWGEIFPSDRDRTNFSSPPHLQVIKLVPGTIWSFHGADAMAEIGATTVLDNCDWFVRKLVTIGIVSILVEAERNVNFDRHVDLIACPIE